MMSLCTIENARCQTADPILKKDGFEWYSGFDTDSVFSVRAVAEVAKLVYAPDLGSGAERHTSSSLVLGTKIYIL